ncbi:hypothetical protein AGMMS49940_15060 [Spirochaetia bacterium]|nr:hypothetical protein AGMMS49940_15060 [Spirochaetia bacterium]
MKSIYVFAFFVSILVSSYGQDNIDFTILKTPYRISLAADAGVLLGQAEEIVYKNSNDDAYLSQLLWDLKPLVYLGSSLSLSRADPLSGFGLGADLSVKFGLPIFSGTMEDRDWVNEAYPDMLTHFSSHNAYIQGAMLLDLAGGITIPIAGRVAIKALVSFSYMRFSWIAQHGYTQYDKTNGWSPSTPKTPVNGTGISYDQNWIILSPGIEVFWPFYRGLSLDFRFFISPGIWSWDMDNHYMNIDPGKKYTQYSDNTEGGLYLEPSLALAFSPIPSLSLVLHGAWRYINGTRGDVYELIAGFNTNSPTYASNRAGVGYSAVDVGLSLKLALPLGLIPKLGSKKTGPSVKPEEASDPSQQSPVPQSPEE